MVTVVTAGVFLSRLKYHICTSGHSHKVVHVLGLISGVSVYVIVMICTSSNPTNSCSWTEVWLSMSSAWTNCKQFVGDSGTDPGFYWWGDRGVSVTPAVPEGHRLLGGVLGHAPPGNFENCTSNSASWKHLGIKLPCNSWLKIAKVLC